MENNYQLILDEINKTMLKVGRKDDILVIAVTKTVDINVVKEFLNFGITDIGENKVQELLKRHEVLGDKVEYHLIGHLQSNKVRKVVGKTKLIHSVDSIKLLDTINRISGEENAITDILAEINISEEENKTGMKIEELDDFVNRVQECDNVRLKGLMTMGPNVEDENLIRNVFRQARELKEQIQIKNYKNVSMEYLSMGMSNDYKIAIEEGANIVRIGSALFGKRNY